VPLYEHKDFGPATVWPIEFYAAMCLEAGLGLETKVEASSDNMITLKRNNSIIGPANDNLPLITFIGVKNYNYIFETPV